LKIKCDGYNNSRTGWNLYNIILERNRNISIPAIQQTSAPDQERYVQTFRNCYLFPFSVNRFQLSLNCTEGCVGPMFQVHDVEKENTSGPLNNSMFHKIKVILVEEQQ
jgi:hypothetical protein